MNRTLMLVALGLVALYVISARNAAAQTPAGNVSPVAGPATAGLGSFFTDLVNLIAPATSAANSNALLDAPSSGVTLSGGSLSLLDIPMAASIAPQESQVSEVISVVPASGDGGSSTRSGSDGD
jgi:hypothetical protein